MYFPLYQRKIEYSTLIIFALMMLLQNSFTISFAPLKSPYETRKLTSSMKVVFIFFALHHEVEKQQCRWN